MAENPARPGKAGNSKAFEDALAAQRTGHRRHARDLWRAATRAEPACADAWAHLAWTLHQLNESLAEAAAAGERAYTLAGASLPAWLDSSMGALARRGYGRWPSLGWFAEAARKSPEQAATQVLYARALMAAGQAEQAIPVLQAALGCRDGARMGVGGHLAEALVEAGRYREAETLARERLAGAEGQTASGASNLKLALAHALDNLGQGQAAIAMAQAARDLADDPSYAEMTLGNIAQAYGDRATAVASYQRALTVRPNEPVVLNRLAALDPESLDEHAWRAIDRLARDAETPRQRGLARLAQAYLADRAGDHVTAAQAYVGGNGLLRQLTGGYDATRRARLVDAIKTTLDAGWCRRHYGIGSDGSGHIFIVGLPRSGTTLVEQILARHPAVSPGGEAPALSAVLGADAAGRTGRFPAWLAELDAATAQCRGAAYRQRMGERTGVAPDQVITDKMPGNLWYVGAIPAILPGARIVLVRRDPIDTAASLFTTYFRTGQRYSYDVRDLATEMRLSRDLADHWESVVPSDGLLKLGYEELVREPAAAIARLLAFVGLSWEPACLHPEATSHRIATASAGQVHRPIASTGLGKGRRFDPIFGPIYDALGLQRPPEAGDPDETESACPSD